MNDFRLSKSIPSSATYSIFKPTLIFATPTTLYLPESTVSYSYPIVALSSTAQSTHKYSNTLNKVNDYTQTSNNSFKQKNRSCASLFVLTTDKLYQYTTDVMTPLMIEATTLSITRPVFSVYSTEHHVVLCYSNYIDIFEVPSHYRTVAYKRVRRVFYGSPSIFVSFFHNDLVLLKEKKEEIENKLEKKEIIEHDINDSICNNCFMITVYRDNTIYIYGLLTDFQYFLGTYLTKVISAYMTKSQIIVVTADSIVYYRYKIENNVFIADLFKKIVVKDIIATSFCDHNEILFVSHSIVDEENSENITKEIFYGISLYKNYDFYQTLSYKFKSLLRIDCDGENLLVHTPFYMRIYNYIKDIVENVIYTPNINCFDVYGNNIIIGASDSVQFFKIDGSVNLKTAIRQRNSEKTGIDNENRELQRNKDENNKQIYEYIKEKFDENNKDENIDKEDQTYNNNLSQESNLNKEKSQETSSYIDKDNIERNNLIEKHKNYTSENTVKEYSIKEKLDSYGNHSIPINYIPLTSKTQIVHIHSTKDLVLTISSLGTATFINSKNGVKIKSFDIPFQLTSTATTTDLDLLCVGTNTGNIFVYDIKRGKCIDNLLGKSNSTTPETETESSIGPVTKMIIRGDSLYTLTLDNIIRKINLFSKKKDILETNLGGVVTDFYIGKNVCVLSGSEALIYDLNLDLIKTIGLKEKNKKYLYEKIALIGENLMAIYVRQRKNSEELKKSENSRYFANKSDIYSSKNTKCVWETDKEYNHWIFIYHIEHSVKVQQISVRKINKFINVGDNLVVQADNGIFIYNQKSVGFCPVDLDVETTPESVYKYINEGLYLHALIASIKLDGSQVRLRGDGHINLDKSEILDSDNIKILDLGEHKMADKEENNNNMIDMKVEEKNKMMIGTEKLSQISIANNLEISNKKFPLISYTLKNIPHESISGITRSLHKKYIPKLKEALSAEDNLNIKWIENIALFHTGTGNQISIKDERSNGRIAYYLLEAIRMKSEN